MCVYVCVCMCVSICTINGTVLRGPLQCDPDLVAQAEFQFDNDTSVVNEVSYLVTCISCS